jgi:hypothetical protein
LNDLSGSHVRRCGIARNPLALFIIGQFPSGFFCDLFTIGNWHPLRAQSIADVLAPHARRLRALEFESLVRWGAIALSGRRGEEKGAGVDYFQIFKSVGGRG